MADEEGSREPQEMPTAHQATIEILAKVRMWPKRKRREAARSAALPSLTAWPGSGCTVLKAWPDRPKLPQ